MPYKFSRSYVKKALTRANFGSKLPPLYGGGSLIPDDLLSGLGLERGTHNAVESCWEYLAQYITTQGVIFPMKDGSVDVTRSVLFSDKLGISRIRCFLPKGGDGKSAERSAEGVAMKLTSAIILMCLLDSPINGSTVLETLSSKGQASRSALEHFGFSYENLRMSLDKLWTVIKSKAGVLVRTDFEAFDEFLEGFIGFNPTNLTFQKKYNGEDELYTSDDLLLGFIIGYLRLRYNQITYLGFSPSSTFLNLIEYPDRVDGEETLRRFVSSLASSLACRMSVEALAGRNGFDHKSMRERHSKLLTWNLCADADRKMVDYEKDAIMITTRSLAKAEAIRGSWDLIKEYITLRASRIIGIGANPTNAYEAHLVDLFLMMRVNESGVDRATLLDGKLLNEESYKSQLQDLIQRYTYAYADATGEKGALEDVVQEFIEWFFTMYTPDVPSRWVPYISNTFEVFSGRCKILSTEVRKPRIQDLRLVKFDRGSDKSWPNRIFLKSTSFGEEKLDSVLGMKFDSRYDLDFTGKRGLYVKNSWHSGVEYLEKDGFSLSGDVEEFIKTMMDQGFQAETRVFDGVVELIIRHELAIFRVFKEANTNVIFADGSSSGNSSESVSVEIIKPDTKSKGSLPLSSYLSMVPLDWVKGCLHSENDLIRIYEEVLKERGVLFSAYLERSRSGEHSLVLKKDLPNDLLDGADVAGAAITRVTKSALISGQLGAFQMMGTPEDNLTTLPKEWDSMKMPFIPKGLVVKDKDENLKICLRLTQFDLSESILTRVLEKGRYERPLNRCSYSFQRDEDGTFVFELKMKRLTDAFFLKEKIEGVFDSTGTLSFEQSNKKVGIVPIHYKALGFEPSNRFGYVLVSNGKAIDTNQKCTSLVTGVDMSKPCSEIDLCTNMLVRALTIIGSVLNRWSLEDSLIIPRDQIGIGAKIVQDYLTYLHSLGFRATDTIPQLGNRCVFSPNSLMWILILLKTIMAEKSVDSKPTSDKIFAVEVGGSWFSVDNPGTLQALLGKLKLDDLKEMIVDGEINQNVISEESLLQAIASVVESITGIVAAFGYTSQLVFPFGMFYQNDKNAIQMVLKGDPILPLPEIEVDFGLPSIGTAVKDDAERGFEIHKYLLDWAKHYLIQSSVSSNYSLPALSQ